MKRILGLDLGTNSIGWALVNEAENENETSEIIKLGVRVNPLTVDEKTDFENGKPISTNADRTHKRSARRNLQRYKLRRKDLIQTLIKNGFITKETPLTEIGKNTTHQTLKLRALAAKRRVGLEDLARIFLAINKKRGYKSNRKVKNEEDGVALDGMETAKYLYDNQLTPGQHALALLQDGKKHIPDFYRSDLQVEFDAVWNTQKTYYSDILSDALYQEMQNKNKGATWAICQQPFNIVGIKLTGKANEQKEQRYMFRVQGLAEKLELEHLAIALQEINNDKSRSSGYLGNISDRSKVLYIDKKTVGEYLWEQIKTDPHTSLKNQVFYRQDYLDEFEKLWETQKEYHSQLTPALKEEIRDTIIFYQRKLKSQKGLLGFCQFESWEEVRKDKNGKPILNKSTGLPKERTVGHRVVSKSSPLFQEFKIWQNINNLHFKRINGKLNGLFKEETKDIFKLDEDQKIELFEELNLRGARTEKQVLKFLKLSDKEWTTNQPIADRKKGTKKTVEGNNTNKALYDVYQTIAEREGYGFDWANKSAAEIKEELKVIFPEIGIKPEILEFNATLDGNTFDKQASYQLWHLLYAAEDDHKISGEDRLVYGSADVSLKKKLHQKFGFKPEYAAMLANISLSDDYGNLSARAIRKLLPYMQAGHPYSQNEDKDLMKKAGAVQMVYGEQKNRAVYDPNKKLEILPKNSLRNPVVEKILNQMVNVVNQISDTYGKPEEIRIELARELKKSAVERDEMTKNINAATKKNDEIKATILKDFGFTATRNDIIRYKLWLELKKNDHKSLFTDQNIPKEKIFSKDIEIEHIIPKALLFDDSFSNKTLAYKTVNLKKADRTALDFIGQDHQTDLEGYKARVEGLYKKGGISKAKYKKLLMSADNLPEGFIERDLRNSQYIAKKATSLLQEVFKTVVATSGNITDKLREDWDLINVMKELNLPKYRELGLTEMQTRWDSGQEKHKEIEVIKDWTKRNDHRHHAMDALTVAFTSHNHIQYINYLNARHNEKHKQHSTIYAIESLITKRCPTGKNGGKKRKFISPMEHFRTRAKKHIGNILISFKTKNKVTTRNVNKTKQESGYNSKVQLTPRGQLHKETVYGKSKRIMDTPTKLNKRFNLAQAQLIADQNLKKLVVGHMAQFDNDPTVAFDNKTLKKQPLVHKGEPLKEVYCFEEIFTIRKDIESDLKRDKVVDKKVREVLAQRLEEYGGKNKEAFSNLDKKPIWLNKEKGICIKRVTITGVKNAEPLHHKKDHLGNLILDVKEQKIPVDYVSLGNNHHVAIYRDKDGKLQEKVVSFYEAVQLVQQKLPVVDKTHNAEIGWEFQFTIKQNEMFVFPNKEDGFNPNDIDLTDEDNAGLISKHLFRVQKIATKNYFFRHHLETTVETVKQLKGIAYHSQLGLNSIEGIIKVRINHLGKIVEIGEY